MKIDGSTILVTGGAKRVGRVIVQHLASLGAKVYIHYNNSEAEAQSLATELCNKGMAVNLIQADLAQAAQLHELATSIPDLDVLINNASVYPRTPIHQIDLTVWSDVFAVNLFAPAILATEYGRQMVKRKKGIIINISDANVQAPYRHYAPYLASKAALEMVTRSLALEFAPWVRVNAVAPGAVLLNENVSEHTREKITRRVPLERIGTPEDVAQTVSFLIECDYITGAVIPVDGGASLRSA
jgi:NAD(P)-dependent dehydrogenase (short-subunit alcohol dehydrogenase family)